MGWFNSRTGRSRGKRRGTPSVRPHLPLGVERLEARTMPDATSTLAHGVLAITGGPGGERISLSLDSSTAQLVLRDAGREVSRYASASVQSITIAGGAGNDRIQIGRNVLQPATIDGGGGDDVIRAGGGATVLLGGAGNNRLIGGPASNLLIGGNGNDIFISPSGHDVIQVGAGQSRLYVTGNDIVVGAKPQDHVYGHLSPTPNFADGPALPGTVGVDPTLTAVDVNRFLLRAAAASPSTDAIIAVVDRGGRILGVRVESGVSPTITGNTANLVFAIDGAVAEARTGAFFGNHDAPLTSRTIEDISQTTITQREVESNPSITDPTSTLAGPGFVAPIHIGGHFPPGVQHTPQVDLFEIQGTNRDTRNDVLPGNERFNIPLTFVPPGQGLSSPDSFGIVSGLLPTARGRGIGTLPGGIPIYEGNNVVVGGIGVFFPGTTGFASEENSSLGSNFDPTKPDRSLEAELIAFTAVGGSPLADSPNRAVGAFDFRGPIGNAPALPPNFPGLPFGRIDLVGITLDLFGPTGRNGPDVLADLANRIGFSTGNALNGVDEPLAPGGVPVAPTINGTANLQAGITVPCGWLVTPHDAQDGSGLTAADVTRIINQGIAESVNIRAAIRLPLDHPAVFVFAVADRHGNILGLYREPDATIFSIDVAVAKARNVAYYNDPTQLQPIDQLPGIQPGIAFTNRTFRYLAEPFFPEGVDGQPPAPFSILNDGGTDPRTGLNVGAPLPASAFRSILGHDAFNPETNFYQPKNPNQNGIVFFPGSIPLYKNGIIVGGLGTSGDGVDQDDDATFFASLGYQPTPNGVPRIDQFQFAGVRLPFMEFNRQPFEP